MAVPKLRFKAADGSQFPDWEEKTIDEVAECLDNKRVPVNAEERKKRVGVIPYYGAGGIQGYIDDYLFDEELVLLLEDGDAFDDFQTKSIAQYVTGKSWVNNHAHVLRANGNSYFLFASLEHKDIRRWTQLAGASRKKLLKDSMLKIIVNMPSLPEQQKIAEFLSTIDTVIEKQKETVSVWEERKKGVMQKLFSQEVRFKADDGSDFPEWEEKKLDEVMSVKDVKQIPTEEAPLMAFIAYQGVAEKGDRYDRSFLVKSDDKKYKRTDFNDFIYSSNNLDVGSIGLNKYGSAVISVVYEIFTFNDGFNPDCMNLLIQQPRIMSSIIRYRQGCLYGQYKIHSRDFLNVLISVPCHEEQQKIADCLVSFDEVIEKQKATLAAWEELKKGLLQQMFV